MSTTNLPATGPIAKWGRLSRARAASAGKATVARLIEQLAEARSLYLVGLSPKEIYEALCEKWGKENAPSKWRISAWAKRNNWEQDVDLLSDFSAELLPKVRDGQINLTDLSHLLDNRKVISIARDDVKELRFKTGQSAAEAIDRSINRERQILRGEQVVQAGNIILYHNVPRPEPTPVEAEVVDAGGESQLQSASDATALPRESGED